MKSKRFLSAFIAVCMLLSLIPAITLNVMAVSYPDPVYSRVGTPEVQSSMSIQERAMISSKARW